jgi:hypothetical protein
LRLKARPGFVPQAEGGIEVLAHDAVFELGCLAQEVRQLFAPFDDDGGLSGHEREMYS